MLPYALKIVWFALSLSGLLSCWAVLGALARAVRSYWIATLYCIGCTILQGVFCLGLIWRMNPFLMPRSFCIAQTLLLGYGTFLLTGVCATFSMATSLAILNPAVWNFDPSKTLAWHPLYCFNIIIFPLLASAAQITVVLKLDAVQPTDNLSCDASSPIWVRLLGYAGTPLVFSIPYSCLALMAVFQMARAQQRLVRSRNMRTAHYDDDSTNLTSLPRRRTRRKDLGAVLGSPQGTSPIPTPRALPSPSPSLAYPTSPGRAPISPTLRSPVLTARQFHLPFSPVAPAGDYNHDALSSSHSSTLEDQYEPGSPASSDFPTFAPPSTNTTPPNPRESPGHHSVDIIGYLNGYRDSWNNAHPQPARVARYSPSNGFDWADDDDDDVSSLRWTRENEDQDIDSEFVHSSAYGYVKDREQFDIVEQNRSGVQDGSDFQYITRSLHANSPAIPSPFGSKKSPKPFPNPATSPNPAVSSLGPAIWRIIIFQLSFTLILLLACISTLIDVIAQHTRPSPFGTQHVALILAAWGPAIVFGHIPSVQQNLISWRRTQTQTTSH